MDFLRELLKTADWRRLFIEELGWDRHTFSVDISIAEPGQQSSSWVTPGEKGRQWPLHRYTFVLNCIAEKRGFVVFVCSPYKCGLMPNFVMRCQLERRLSKLAHHHIIIFTNGDNTHQIWQWAHNTEDGKREYCEHKFVCNESDSKLLDRLDRITCTFDEENRLTLVEILQRVQSAFYFSRKQIVYWRLRLNQHDLSKYGVGVQALVQMAYVRRGLPQREEYILAYAAYHGDRGAAEHLLEAHIYIAVETAWKIKHNRHLIGIELEDLIMEGYIGLLSAQKSFQPDKGIRFRIYAARLVQSRIVRAILRFGRIIYLPSHIDVKYMPYALVFDLVQDKITQELEREPNRQEMAKGLGLSLIEMDILDIVRAEYVTWQNINYDEADNAQENYSIGEIEERAVLNIMCAEMLARLTARQQLVLSMRYGMELTLDEVSIRLNITRERVRQIEAQAISKLTRITATYDVIEQTEEKFVGKYEVKGYHKPPQDKAKGQNECIQHLAVPPSRPIDIPAHVSEFWMRQENRVVEQEMSIVETSCNATAAPVPDHVIDYWLHGGVQDDE